MRWYGFCLSLDDLFHLVLEELALGSDPSSTLLPGSLIMWITALHPWNMGRAPRVVVKFKGGDAWELLMWGVEHSKHLITSAALVIAGFTLRTCHKVRLSEVKSAQEHTAHKWYKVSISLTLEAQSRRKSRWNDPSGFFQVSSIGNYRKNKNHFI